MSVIRKILSATMLLAALGLGAARAASPPVRLYTGALGASVWNTDNTKVGVSVQIVNGGSGDAADVRVTSVTVRGGTAGAIALPFALGTIGASQDAMIDLLATVPKADGTPYLMTIAGTYVSAGTTYGFSLNRSIVPVAAAPGPFPVHGGVLNVQNPELATYPPAPAPAVFGPNAETPIIVPIGPFRQVFPATPTATPAQPGSTAGGSVVIPVNTGSLANTSAIPPDPNAAAQSPSGVVLSTFNNGINQVGTSTSGIRYSTNGGATFTDIALLNPQPGNPSRKTFFPESDGGLCCDQVVVYLPAQNLFVWLLQYNPVTACATNCPPSAGVTSTYKITQSPRLRVAWARPADIADDFYSAWTYADLTGIPAADGTGGLGIKANEWLDYPDLAWSATYLYVGIDHGTTTPGSVYIGKRIVARLSLADIGDDTATTIHYDYAELSGPAGLNKTHFVQSAPGQMVVGALKDSSTLNVFAWVDGASSIPAPSTIGISTIQQGGSYTSTDPNSVDWLAASFPGNITGAAYGSFAQFGAPSIDEYTFAFDAGVNNPSRPQSYVRLETVTPDGAGGFKAFSEYDIWNGSYAYAMAALGTDMNNVTPQIGITLSVGGGTIGFPQIAVGFKDDFVVYQVTSSNGTQQISGTTRWGDYLCARLVPNANTTLFAAEAYDVKLNPLPPGTLTGTCNTVGCTTTMRYVEFGRPPVIGPR